MLMLWAVLMIGSVMTAPAAADEMSPNQAHRFVVGRLFEVSCFDGTRAIGRIDGDGSVIGTIQFRGTGPERSAWHCHVEEWQTRECRPIRLAQAAAVTSRHVCVADARKARCVLAEVRWRWTLKVL